MSKMAEIKEKIFSKILILKEKFASLKKVGTKAASTSPKYRDDFITSKLMRIYREGETSTRLAVIFALLCFLIFAYSLSKGFYRVAARYKSEIKDLSHENAKAGQNISDFLKQQSEYIQSMGSMVSLGKITVNFRNRDNSIGHVSLDIWIKCDAPETANYVQEIFPILHDAVSDSLAELSRDQIMTETGKVEVKTQLIAALNTRLKKGKVTDVFFHNLMLQ